MNEQEQEQEALRLLRLHTTLTVILIVNMICAALLLVSGHVSLLPVNAVILVMVLSKARRTSQKIDRILDKTSREK